MQNILNKLAKIQKAQPKRSKFTQAKPNRVAVKLSVIDDIESELDAFEQAEAECAYMADEWGDQLIDEIDEYRSSIQGQVDNWAINGTAYNLKEYAENIMAKLTILENSANELGVDPNDLYADFDELKARVENADALWTDAKDKYREVQEYSGVLAWFW